MLPTTNSAHGECVLSVNPQRLLQPTRDPPPPAQGTVLRVLLWLMEHVESAWACGPDGQIDTDFSDGGTVDVICNYLK